MQAIRHAEVLPRALVPSLPAPSGVAGTIAGYGAVFDRVDAQSDVIRRGAFARSLARHARAGTWPAMLWQHGAREPIGRWEEIVEDAVGLRLGGHLVLETQRGAEAAALMRAGALTGLSIGYVAVESHRDRGRGVRVLTEIELIEVSPVTFPAQPLARIAAPRGFDAHAVWSAYHRARAALAVPDRRFVTPGDHWREQPRVPRGDPHGGRWTDGGDATLIPTQGRGGFRPPPRRAPSPGETRRPGDPGTRPDVQRPGFLRDQEGPGKGHTIERHVGKTVVELRERLRRDPDIPAASSFYDLRTAERTIRSALERDDNRFRIEAWIADPRRRPLVLEHRSFFSLGTIVDRIGVARAGHRASIVLRKDEAGGFFVETAYLRH